MSNFTHSTEKLRIEASAALLDGFDISAARLTWAADRIEALEAALTEIVARALYVLEVDNDADIRTLARIAREALVVRTDASEAPDAE